MGHLILLWENGIVLNFNIIERKDNVAIFKDI